MSDVVVDVNVEVLDEEETEDEDGTTLDVVDVVETLVVVG